MHAYTVGELYHPDKTQWEEATNYNFRSGGHELLLFMNHPTAKEKRAFRQGEADFAFTVINKSLTM